MPNVIATQPNIGGTLNESSVISFLVPRHKVWLMAAAWVPCSNARNIGECKTWTQSKFYTSQNSVTGQQPRQCIYSVPAQETAWPTSCKVWLASVQRHRCSNEAKTQNLLKFGGVMQTNETILAASKLKFTILWGHVEEILLFNKFFFPIVDTCLSCEDTAWQSCAMVPRWRFFGEFWDPAFPASLVQHISDLHSKFALGPHHVQKDGRRGKKQERKKPQDKTRMWANAQLDGRPADYRWRPLFSAAKFG